jgi:hypothetical protein
MVLIAGFPVGGDGKISGDARKFIHARKLQPLPLHGKRDEPLHDGFSALSYKTKRRIFRTCF